MADWDREDRAAAAKAAAAKAEKAGPPKPKKKKRKVITRRKQGTQAPKNPGPIKPKKPAPRSSRPAPPKRPKPLVPPPRPTSDRPFQPLKALEDQSYWANREQHPHISNKVGAGLGRALESGWAALAALAVQQGPTTIPQGWSPEFEQKAAKHYLKDQPFAREWIVGPNLSESLMTGEQPKGAFGSSLLAVEALGLLPIGKPVAGTRAAVIGGKTLAKGAGKVAAKEAAVEAYHARGYTNKAVRAVIQKMHKGVPINEEELLTLTSTRQGRKIIARAEGLDPESMAVPVIKDIQAHVASKASTRNPLPKNVRSVKTLGRKIGEAIDRTLEGAPYARYWYRDSGKAILARAGGDKAMADKLAALTALYSPRKPVLPNIGQALRVYQQFLERGVVESGQEWQQRAAEMIMRNEDWLAGMGPDDRIKVRSFYANLLKHIDPELMKAKGFTGREVTIDGWMFAAFGYGENTSAAAGVKAYRTVEKIVQDIADGLGMQPEEVQAAIWTSIKASKDVSLKAHPRPVQLARAGNSYVEGLDQVTHNLEIPLDAFSDEFPEIATWDEASQALFIKENADAIAAALQDHGIYAHATDLGWGVNPRGGVHVSVGSSYVQGEKYQLLPGDQEFFDGLAGIIAEATGKKEVNWMRTFASKSEGEHTAYRVTGLAKNEAQKMADDLSEIASVTWTPKGTMIVAKEPERILNPYAKPVSMPSPTQIGKTLTQEQYDEQFIAHVKGRRAGTLKKEFSVKVRAALDSANVTNDQVKGFTHRGGSGFGYRGTDKVDRSGRSALLDSIHDSVSDSTAKVREAWVLTKDGARGARAPQVAGAEPGYLEALRPRVLTIKEAAPQLSWFRATRIASKEARYPGYIDAQVALGILPDTLQYVSIKPRVIGGTYMKAAMPAARSQSRSRMGRTGQSLYDAYSRNLDKRKPGARFGASNRAARAAQREMSLEGKRLDARIARQEREINKALPRVLRGDQRYEHALMAALQAPEDMSVRQATEVYLNDITRILEDPTTLDPYAIGRVVHAADRDNFGTVTEKLGNDASLVHFLGRDGSEAYVELSNDLLTPREDLARIEGHLKRQQKALKGALESEKIDSEEMKRAVETATEIARESEEIYKDIMGISDEGLAIRRNRVAALWAEQGLIPPAPESVIDPETGELVGDWARAYFPHVAYQDKLGSGSTQVGSFGAVADVVGKTRRQGFETRKWVGYRYRTGDIESNPRVVTNLLRNRHRYLRSVTARETLFNSGDKIINEASIPKRGKWVVVRSQQAESGKIPGMVRQALHEPDAYARAFADAEEAGVFLDADGTLDFIKKNMGDWYFEFKNGDISGAPAWIHDVENVSIVPERVARTLLGDAFYTAPRNWFSSFVATLNNVTRTAVIYTPYGGSRYVARNTVQNQVLMALTQPKAFMRMRQTLEMWLNEKDIWDAVRVETGSIQATAGLPEVLRSATRAQMVEKRTNEAMRAIGQGLGDVTDEPWRVSAWFQYAREYGFKNKDEVRRLLNSEEPAIARIRQQISQYVREDMIDFDAIPTNLRETLTRYFFIMPFMVGATKWPVMFAREYPFRAAMLGVAAYWSYSDFTAKPGQPQSVREWGRIPEGVPVIGGRDMGWPNPLGPAAENVQRFYKTGRETINSFRENEWRQGAIKLAGLAEFLGPMWREFAKSIDDRGSKLDNIASDVIPGWSTGIKLARGGSVMQQLDRALGQEIATPEWRKKERKDEMTKVDGWIKQVDGDLGDYTLEQLSYSIYAYQMYKDMAARAEYNAKDIGREISYKERTQLLVAAVSKYFPEGNWPTPDQISKAREDQLETYYENLRRNLLKPRTSLQSRARRRAEEG